jgi:hypothetical protein
LKGLLCCDVVVVVLHIRSLLLSLFCLFALPTTYNCEFLLYTLEEGYLAGAAQNHQQSQQATIMNNPPVVANAQVQARLVAHGNPGNDRHTRAGNAQKRLKTTHDAYASGTVTTPELGEQAAYATNEAMLAAAPVRINGANGIRNDINRLTAIVNNQFQLVNDQLATMNTRSQNSENRWKNSTALLNNDEVHVILLPNGNLPPIAPLNFNQLVTVTDVNSLTDNQRAAMLRHYNLPVNPQATRLTRLRRHFGLP